MTFNNFGAVYGTVLALLPDTVAADFGTDATDGQNKITAQLSRIAREVAGAFTEEVYRCLADVAELEMVVKYAAAGQTTCTIGLTPVVPGSLHLWRFGRDDDLGIEPIFGVNELAFTLNAGTGAVTAITPALSLGDKVFATYEVDCEDEDFSWPSVADVVALGAAAALGAQLYTQGTQEWGLIDDLRARYRGSLGVSEEGGTLAKARKGDWVPDELRTLRWWREIERSSDDGIGSVRKYRA